MILTFSLVGGFTFITARLKYSYIFTCRWVSHLLQQDWKIFTFSLVSGFIFITARLKDSCIFTRRWVHIYYSKTGRFLHFHSSVVSHLLQQDWKILTFSLVGEFHIYYSKTERFLHFHSSVSFTFITARLKDSYIFTRRWVSHLLQQAWKILTFSLVGEFHIYYSKTEIYLHFHSSVSFTFITARQKGTYIFR